MFFVFFGDTLSDSVAKKLGFALISFLFFLFPFLIFRIRTSFLINGIFVLLAPLEIAQIYLNKQTIGSGFIMLILQTDLHEVLEILNSIKPFIIIELFIFFLYFFLIFKLPKNKFLTTNKSKLFALVFYIISLFSLYIYCLTVGLKVTSGFSEAMSFSKAAYFQKFSKIYPCDMVMSINGGIRTYHEINKPSADIDKFRFSAKKRTQINEKEVYVLVIGETARYSNFSVNNYNRETSPLLSKITNLVSFSDVYSEANETQTSLPILLTRATAEHFNVFKKEKSVVDAFKEAGFSTYWIANQSFGNPFIQRIVKNTKGHFFAVKDYDSLENYDEMLWVYLDKILAKNEKKQFIVIHTLGSHFRYNYRYPKSFRKFQPDFEGAFDYGLINRQNKERLINSYDNSILYTDYFLSNTIKKINQKSALSFMFYTSDHGENLYETDHVLHGGISPTIYDVHVPLFVWTSDKYNQEFPNKKACLTTNKHKSITSSVVFYSLLDLADIEIKGNIIKKSICSPLLQNDSIRLMLNPNKRLIDMSSVK